MTTVNPLHSTGSVEHYTPAYIVEAARHALGGSIALDPASCSFANEVVKAAAFYDHDGLAQPWYGPMLLNPPGKSPTNPSGAGPWWQKLVETWEAIDDFKAIYIGFSLEQLQTLQSWGDTMPLDFTSFCVPAQRIGFDVEAVELRAKLLTARRDITDPKKIKALEAKIVKVDEAIKRGYTRYPGDSPTHGNFIVMLGAELEDRWRFREAFDKIGWCS